MLRTFASGVALLAMAACSQTSQNPQPPQVLNQVPLTKAASGDVPNSLVYRAPDLAEKPAPRCFYIPPAKVDSGPEAQFLEVTDTQKQVVAGEVTAAFRHAIGLHQHVVTTPDPHCATLELYLTGVTKSSPYSGSATNPYSTLLGMTDQSTRNLGASVNGTITVAGKFVDPNGDLLAAFVSNVGTNAFDIPPDADPRQVARLAADRLANDIADAVDREVAIQKHNAARQGT